MNVLVLVMNGKVRYSINGEKIIAEKGDILFIPRTTNRSGKNHPSGPHQKYTILFTDSEMGKTGIPFLDQKQFIKNKPKSFEYFKRRFENLYTDLRGNKKYRSFVCNGILQELIGRFARELEAVESSPMKLKYAQDIQDYLIAHYREQIRIDKIAKRIQKSPNYAVSIFKEVTGQTPIVYVHQLRILEACNLLLYSDMSIANISDHLGYYDASYFSKTFKKITSLTPKEYKEMGMKREEISFNNIFKIE